MPPFVTNFGEVSYGGANPINVLKRNQKLLVYSLILFVPFFFLFSKSPAVVPFKLKLFETVSFPLKIVSIPFQEIKKFFLYHYTYDQYQKLKKDYAALRARLIGLDEVFIENKRYEKLLEFKRNLVFSSVAANVIGRDPSNWNAVVLIDKGERDGLTPGMPVVNALGVVGKISEVTSKSSKVILLNDPGFSVAAVVQRSREGGLISGTLQGLCRMRYLSAGADIKTGDIVVTSRLSSSFPEGLLIGKVISLEESQSSPGAECLIQPAVSSSQFEEVLVIKK